MATIHISQAEAERDLSGLIARVDENTSFLIENGSEPVAVLQAAPPRKLSLRERIALLSKEDAAVIDDDWPSDLDAAIERHRAPLDRKLWE
jgi:antitoxin (DNA-binding transcriptional repressor) of toxin-antitoxin stability system